MRPIAIGSLARLYCLKKYKNTNGVGKIIVTCRNKNKISIAIKLGTIIIIIIKSPAMLNKYIARFFKDLINNIKKKSDIKIKIADFKNENIIKIFVKYGMFTIIIIKNPPMPNRHIAAIFKDLILPLINSIKKKIGIKTKKNIIVARKIFCNKFADIIIYNSYPLSSYASYHQFLSAKKFCQFSIGFNNFYFYTDIVILR